MESEIQLQERKRDTQFESGGSRGILVKRVEEEGAFRRSTEEINSQIFAVVDNVDEDKYPLLNDHPSENEVRLYGEGGHVDGDSVSHSRDTYTVNSSQKVPLNPIRQAAADCLWRPFIIIFAAIVGIFILSSRWSLAIPKHPKAWSLGIQKCKRIQLPLQYPAVKHLTLLEKIHQMVAVELEDVQDGLLLQSSGVGAITMIPREMLSRWNKSPEEWLNTTSTLQAHALQTRLQIPVLFGASGIHGHSSVYGATVFPHAIGLGATRNYSLIALIGFATGQELAATGVRWSLGPTLSVCRDPRWGGCYRCYSENAAVARRCASAVDGLDGSPSGNGFRKMLKNETLVAATALGYMGEGGSRGGVSGGDTRANHSSFKATHMRPFFDANIKGLSMAELATGSYNGVPLHNNSFVINIYKKQLGFKGVLLSGYRGIETIPGDWGTQVRTSVNVGLDMIRVGLGKGKQFVDALQAEVLAGRVPEARIDDAVSRVLRVKRELGLFESPCAHPKLGLEFVGSGPHRQLARSAVRQSLVLLKNGGGGKEAMLPLPTRGKTFLVTGSHANNLGYQCGGYTIWPQGSSGSITKGTTILDGIKASLSKSSTLLYDPDLNLVQEADFAVVIVGELPYAEAAGDEAGTTSGVLRLPVASEDLILDVCQKWPCLIILILGRPLVIEHLLPAMNALVVAWLPGSEGNGIADVIFDEPGHEFVGRLPITWLRTVDQLPLNYGDLNYNPLFPFGFGLTMNGTLISG